MEVIQVSVDVEIQLKHSEEKIERATRNAFYEVGLELRHIRDNELYRERYGTFEDYVETRWEWHRSRAYQLIDAATFTETMSTIVDILPQRETHVRPLLKLEKPEQQIEVWQRVITNTNGHNITAKLVEAEVQRKQAELEKDWITLTEWQALDGAEQKRILTQPNLSSKTMSQVNENIEWALYSWNPITGCLHNCSYCYARDIANRFYPQNFEPSFKPGRLTAPANTKVPSPRWQGDIGYQGVFVCSMADLFGKWVPQDWIAAILTAITDNPQWTFLLLSKFPIRMAEFEYPPNVWLGTTVDYQHAVERAEKAFTRIKASGFEGVCWLSCEPMMERLTFDSLGMFDWVVMGGASKSTQTPEHRPRFDDIVHLYNQARQAGCMVYQKTNLIHPEYKERVREYPQKRERIHKAALELT